MFTIEIYSFSKKRNSTARPSGGATLLQCNILEPCAIIAPTITVNYGNTQAPVNFNYAHIPAFERYYYVTDWTYSEGLWYGKLLEDVLATWKSEIGSTHLYIARAAARFNNHLIDTEYPTQGNVIMQVSTLESPFKTSGRTQGTFVLGVMNGASTGNQTTQGAITFYFCNASTIRELCEKLYNAELDYTQINFEDLNTLTGITADVLKTMFNPMQYITSCIFLPLALDIEGGEPIKVGFWDTGIMGYGYNIEQTWWKQQRLSIPKHPQRGERGDWLDLSPYSTYQLTLPAIGQFQLDSAALAGHSEIAIDYHLDLVTGEVAVQIAIPDVGILKQISAPLGVNVAIGGLAGTTNTAAVLLSAGLQPVGAIAENAAKTADTIAYMRNPGEYGWYGGGKFFAIPEIDEIPQSGAGSTIRGIAGTATNIGSAVNAAMRNADIISTNGSHAKLAYYSVQLQAMFYRLCNDDNDDIGRPLMEIATPESLGGYMKVHSGEVEMRGTQDEFNSINAFLKGGFYYE